MGSAYCLVRLSTPSMPDTRGLDDALLPLYLAFQSLGLKVEMRVNSFSLEGRNICLGANYDPQGRWHKIPPDAIIFNLEQLTATGYPWQGFDEYFKLLATHEVWDFSRANVDYLASQGIAARFLPLGYVPAMTRLAPCPDPVGDVLFYGAMTPRRRQVLEELTRRGFKVNRLDKAYGARRDRALYSTKLLLNIHHSLPASLEVVRLGYVWANRRAVVSELAPTTDFYPELGQACTFAPYEGLVEMVSDLLADPEKQKQQAQQGFESFKSLRLDKDLAEILGLPSACGAATFGSVMPGLVASGSVVSGSKISGPPRPKHLRVGSGADFINQALNVDIEPRYHPDLVLDLTKWAADIPHFTSRFGQISLAAGSFEVISAPHFLDSISQAEQLMAVFLELLTPEGHLILTLAWSPPPELGGSFSPIADYSAFSKTYQSIIQGNASWPDLRGRLGYGFKPESVEYEYSDLGRILLGRGWSVEKVHRTTGTITRLRIVLVKRVPASDEVLASVAPVSVAPAPDTSACGLHREYYDGPTEVWQVEEYLAPILTDSLSPQKYPSSTGLLLEFLSQTLKLWRYRLHLRFGLGHGRYPDKVAATRRKLHHLRELMGLRP